MSSGTRHWPALGEKRAGDRARRIAPASDGRGCCGRGEPVQRPARSEQLEMEADRSEDDDGGNGGEPTSRGNGCGNRSLAGADTLAIVMLRRWLTVMVPRILHRPGGLIRTGMGRVHRQPGDAGRGEEQHQGCKTGPERAEDHRGESSYERPGGKGFRVGRWETDRAGFEPARGL